MKTGLYSNRSVESVGSCGGASKSANGLLIEKHRPRSLKRAAWKRIKSTAKKHKTGLNEHDWRIWLQGFVACHIAGRLIHILMVHRGIVFRVAQLQRPWLGLKSGPWIAYGADAASLRQGTTRQRRFRAGWHMPLRLRPCGSQPLGSFLLVKFDRLQLVAYVDEFGVNHVVLATVVLAVISAIRGGVGHRVARKRICTWLRPVCGWQK